MCTFADEISDDAHARQNESTLSLFSLNRIIVQFLV